MHQYQQPHSLYGSLVAHHYYDASEGQGSCPSTRSISEIFPAAGDFVCKALAIALYPRKAYLRAQGKKSS